jgi:hypothetical protein
MPGHELCPSPFYYIVGREVTFLPEELLRRPSSQTRLAADVLARNVAAAWLPPERGRRRSPRVCSSLLDPREADAAKGKQPAAGPSRQVLRFT